MHCHKVGRLSFSSVAHGLCVEIDDDTGTLLAEKFGAYETSSSVDICAEGTVCSLRAVGGEALVCVETHPALFADLQKNRV